MYDSVVIHFDAQNYNNLFFVFQLTYLSEQGTEVGYKDPLLVEHTSGIGSKLKLALKCRIYDTIGNDLVAMCANEVVCAGAQPFAFLDYVACGKLDVPVVAQIVKGISEGCRAVNSALLGIILNSLVFLKFNYSNFIYCFNL